MQRLFSSDGEAMKKIEIVRIPILPFGMVNCHLLVGDDGCVLVDTGLPTSTKKIVAALKAAGRGYGDLKLIVVTHAHVDHAGGAAKLRALNGAPILAHGATWIITNAARACISAIRVSLAGCSCEPARRTSSMRRSRRIFCCQTGSCWTSHPTVSRAWRGTRRDTPTARFRCTWRTAK